MTEIGAIKELENWRNTFKSFRVRRALEIAIRATRKQIPLVPDIEGDSSGNNGNIIYDTYICPNCGMDYELEYEEYDYCPNCGQRIDLESVKNEAT
jgi:rubrerythrin